MFWYTVYMFEHSFQGEINEARAKDLGIEWELSKEAQMDLQQLADFIWSSRAREKTLLFD